MPLPSVSSKTSQGLDQRTCSSYKYNQCYIGIYWCLLTWMNYPQVYRQLEINVIAANLQEKFQNSKGTSHNLSEAWCYLTCEGFFMNLWMSTSSSTAHWVDVLLDKQISQRHVWNFSDCTGKLVKMEKLMRLQEVVDKHIKIINWIEIHCCTIMKEGMGTSPFIFCYSGFCWLPQGNLFIIRFNLDKM